MRIMAISDTESTALWDHYNSNKITDTDLILSCGDLNPNYLCHCCMCMATTMRNTIRHRRKGASALMIKFTFTKASVFLV